MLPKYHIILGVLFSISIWFIFPQITFSTILIIFLSSVLIDIDHYAVYVYRKKDLSLKRAFNWYISLEKIYKKKIKKNPKLKFPFLLFHTIEFLIIITLISVYFNYFYILIGFLFHYIVDTTDLIFKNFLNAREFSLIKYLISDKTNYL